MLRSQNIIDSAASTSTSGFISSLSITRLEEEVDDLKKIKIELISSKNEVPRYRDARQQQENYQVAESSQDVKMLEFDELKLPSLEAALNDKEKDIQIAFMDQAEIEILIGLVMDSTGLLNPILIRGVYDRFLQTTHKQSILYQWLVVVMLEFVRNLVSIF
ncbi:hypothetical protein M9H77_11830 [Catharanthus roseus]|uniref:Uncharacterized protein n=1 Tax=Catharanthus roseus TaxID=4058 RepID=A0ACC0BFP9_CATRO|nr:hypothetical protein M9H77_11830 [Catharanthus roseus]